MTCAVSTVCGSTFQFCVCDVCAKATAEEHKAADARCGREWSCQCAACRRTREVNRAEIDAGFKRIEELEADLRRVRALKAVFAKDAIP